MQKKSIIVLTVAALSANAFADKPAVQVKENQNLTATANYWTADRFKNAKPMPLPQLDTKLLNKKLSLPNKEKPVVGDGAGPTFHMTPENKSLFKASLQTSAPNDNGNRNLHFSSSQLVPISADQSYPYTTIGRLYFTDPMRGDMYCTAAVINKRVIVTAGHCLHNGSGSMNGFYDHFAFVPAYRDGYAPFQTWTWSFAGVSSSWFYSGGRIPNDADYGMLEIQNNYINGAYRNIASVTGFLGYQTNNLAPNHAHIIGYANNFDGGQKMHQVTAQSGGIIEANNVEYGSDMERGSSGSPIIQNFGMPAMGQMGGRNPGFNRLIGVITWGTTAPGSMTEGASNPDYRFVEVLNKICAHHPENC